MQVLATGMAEDKDKGDKYAVALAHTSKYSSEAVGCRLAVDCRLGYEKRT